jgi:hypothetical protein
MKKELIIPPMLPYTSDEEVALAAKLRALSGAELIQYIESAENSLNGNALAPSWRPRIELGLSIAKAALPLP